ncbi:hypothetical protein NQD34_001341 [Periophthalmus magnuspinnatus]|nr:hypothetical protein NQD34_001341 [Periophthalmus magnuspinnatus]
MLSDGGRISSIPLSRLPRRKQRLGTLRRTRPSPWLKSLRWLTSSSVARLQGVDEIHPDYLVVELCWLTRLCNIAWQSGTVPLDWQTGVVVPLFKKGVWVFQLQGNHTPQPPR